MSKIEISLAEYNGLKDKIKSLEEKLVDMSKEIKIYKNRMDDYNDFIADLEQESLINRVFHWKNIFKPFKEII